MTFNFSELSGTDFALGAFGATIVDVYRLKCLLKKNSGKVQGSRLQLFVNAVWFFLFVVGSGLLAAVQGVSPELSAFYIGLTSPVFFGVILKDNDQAERELIEKIEKPKNEEIAFQKAFISAKYREIDEQQEEINGLRSQVLELEKRLSYYSRSNRFRSNKIVNLVDELTRERSNLSQIKEEPLTVSSSEVRNDVQERVESLMSRLLGELLNANRADREEGSRFNAPITRVNVSRTSALEQMGQIHEEGETNLENINKEKIANRQLEKATYLKRFTSIGYSLLLIAMLTIVYLLYPDGNVLINFTIGLVMSILSNVVYNLVNKSEKLRRFIYRTF